MDYKKSASIYVSIYIIAFILVNLISMNWFIRFDLTDNKMYSLSDSSKKTIEKIDDPLTIDLYFSDDLPGQLQNNKRFVQDLLEEYSAYSGNVNFYFIKNDENFNILDLGCGGGLVCEPLARLGANITGIDFVKQNIIAAKKHAKKLNINIEYLHQNINNLKLKKKYDKILVEEYIPGKEIQVAVMGEKALGAIELIPRREFYDYTAKYSAKAKTKHVMPATLSQKKYSEALYLAKKAHKALGCRGITRSDFRFFRNKFYLLEINTQPGMTSLSLVPEIAQYCGIKFEDLVVWMIKDASSNR